MLAFVTVKVKITMIRHSYWSTLLLTLGKLCFHVNLEGLVLQSVGSLYLNFTWVLIITIRTRKTKCNTICYSLRSPLSSMPTNFTAMEVVFVSAVDIEHCFNSINRKPRISCTVCNSTDCRPKAWILISWSIILLPSVKPENAVIQVSVFVWKHKFNNGCTKVT